MPANLAGEICRSFTYVVFAPFFWQAMALVTIISMFVGVLVYNGDLGKLGKTTMTIITYGGMIMLTSITRIYSYTQFSFAQMLQGQGLAGPMTILIVTIFYLIGLYLGLVAHKLGRRGNHV